MELRGAWKEDGRELQAVLYGQRGGARLRIGGAWEAGCPARPFARLELTGGSYQFWLSAAAWPDDPEVSLGWSAAQPLPKSPTSRTSRSRR